MAKRTNIEIETNQDVNIQITTKSKDNGFQRHRFSVPNKDTQVLEWIEEQSNLSMSIRQLIKDAIKQDGIMDATCRPV